MTVIPSEIERFDRLSATWWHQQGPMRPLHVVNALRLGYVVAQMGAHWRREPSRAVSGLRVLDIGCGGGLIAEPLARMGARVVGVDASPGNVSAARLHAAEQGIRLDYRLGEMTDALNQEERFDVVLALEVVEHVSDVPAFLAAAAGHVAPGGMLMVSTIDRTWKSFLFAIVGAEYLLRVLPRGTHQWSQFVRPDELDATLAKQGLLPLERRGMRYLPWVHRATWCTDTRVNYIATYAHPELPRRKH
ncbi:bifunctional 2-polyprenyl-6-hydroxyphenol methylase/3-demethylubiquinol 3-O-methyltransferase UbiG [Curvibacter sp. RS43]|uniref:bifunctional 2-polyprenyl-6-hydroxyphenol methylase/3-demethylubiquinol 3-O-methyltransferase UbiG n=1 Tax=Curvibacter microcysteis TaxID=3026419 RepID=UPI00236250FA|nr:bifunctional 2-polyprenyl-6-hydroxyphenol methylase/3-demethylubiquinol 3-O-methyltransferase UbiG [Curvibacter sp. RS43]MDD0811517.1 bifunctional 2-polyprenyl-6-hydroxyphenol methylase/3-demethylubiquinol 3-O-methyltransferase UbiG [Curvibacter sp. RS43]